MDPKRDFDSGLTQCLGRLRRFAFALSRNAADADDLTQSTVERALKSRSQWSPGSRMDSWLYRIMRNYWIDLARARTRIAKVEVVEDDVEQVGFDPVPGIEASIDLKIVMTAMDRLPDEQREVVALILVEGVGYRETSELLDLPIGTVSSRLVRGRNALLQSLEIHDG